LRSPLIVSRPLSIETSSSAGFMPGAKATISTVSSVTPMLTCGNVPRLTERMLDWKPRRVHQAAAAAGRAR
jgi:hypothetical protein